jgi:Holliday junction resolvase RusA-like endonuclease
MTAIEFTIIGRPFAKERPRADNRRGGRARIYTPTKTIKAERAVLAAAKPTLDGAPLYGEPLSGPVKLEVLAVFAIPKSWTKAKQEAARQGRVWHTSSPDADNILKLVSDALNGHAFVDDGLVVDTRATKRFGYPERTVVRITPLTNWNDA